MEPLHQAITIIEGVTEEICSAFGNDALKRIDPDRLFAKAELHIKNGLSVDAAKEEILASIALKPEKCQERRRSRIDSSGATTSSSENTSSSNDSEEIGTQLLHGHDLEETSSHSAVTYNGNDLKAVIGQKSESSTSCAGSSKVDVVSQMCNSNLSDPCVADLGYSEDSKSRKASSSSETDVKHFQEVSSLENKQNDSEQSEEKFDSQRSNPPVTFSESERKDINTTECKSDSSETDYFSGFCGPSSSGAFQGHGVCNKEAENVGAATSQSGCDLQADLSSIGSPEVSVLSPSPKPTPLIDLGDDSTCSDRSSCNSDIVVVDEVEKSLNAELKLGGRKMSASKAGKGMSDFEGILNIPGASSLVPSKDFGGKSVEYAVDQAFDLAYTSESNIMVNKMETHSVDYNKINSPESQMIDMQQSLENAVELGKNDSSQNQKTRKQNGSSDFFDSDSSSEEDPNDKLWKDAQFICSLLPFFELADVHETMVANFYHPDRKAHVLEAYIQLALDRDEMVPDNVFLSLNAARKRSHAEACGQEAVNGKKQKVGHGDPGPAAFGNTYNAVNVFVEANEPVPSTSRVVPSAVFSDRPDSGVQENASSLENREEREKWIREKLDFVSAVVCDMDKDHIRTQLSSCYSDVDVGALVTRLLEEPPRPQVASQLNIASGTVSEANNQPNTSAFQAVDRGRPAEVPVSEDNSSSGEGPSGEGEELPNAADTEDRIMVQINTLAEMFSDADPDYLRERCISLNGKQEDFQALVEELMEKKEYPKLEEYLKRQKRLEIKKKFIEGMSVEEFLEYFEDPEKVFCDTEKKMSVTYMENARTQLLRDLPYHLSKDIDNFEKGNRKLSRRKTKRVSPPKESDLDDIFIKEQCYVRMELEIKEYLLKKEENKRRAFLWAKAANQLQECGCCYDDEILEEDMDSCNSPEMKHKFCCNCIRRFAEEEIGQGRINFRCLEGDCKAEFSLGTLKKLLKPSVFSNILARKQLEEIAAAGIEDLESCPFCNFQTIMPNREDKVFKCLNPDCMKDSCRLCKEPNHVPLRCEEVEKQHQKDARTFLENKMTEAMVRECWKCKKRFIKADGCNKMRCACGAMMCYICKKAIKGYDHFEDNPVPINKNKCPLWSNSEKIHAEEVRDAAKKLKDELDPGIELKHDPTKDLPEIPKHLEHRPTPNVAGFIPPPAHQRRDHHHVIPRYGALFPPPLAHHHQRVPPQAHHHIHQVVPQIQIDHHQPPQPAHQHPAIPPIHLVINPGRNDYHHHHHHHYHHHVRHQPDAREVGEDRRVLLEQINEFNEIIRNVRQEHQQENLPPVVYAPNLLRFQQRVVQHHPPQNLQNLPQEPHDPFIREI
ncbi:LOW QUALITY PROTEIN: uncharacterized protein [Macrobrachium rosenbergii]|uniref:LOW QUALITY PROTEIN: uncharacterized protein n=1 Tax=Macrobrachium rosenbergii TaxID=79674 RepID=UPI0034D5D97D